MTHDEMATTGKEVVVNLDKFREQVLESVQSKRWMLSTQSEITLMSGWCNPDRGVVSSMDVSMTQRQLDKYREIDERYRRAQTVERLQSMPVPPVAAFTPPEEDEEPEPEPELGKSIYDSRHYADSLFTNAIRIVTEYEGALRTGRLPEHDTLVGTGLSGSMALPLLGSSSGKMYAAVRKLGVDSHSDRMIEGRVGAKWLFIDDFISSGRTLKRVRNMMDREVPRSQFVGSWLYSRGEFKGLESS